MHFQKSFNVYKKVSENKESETCEDNVQFQTALPNELSRKTPNSIHRFVL